MLPNLIELKRGFSWSKCDSTGLANSAGLDLGVLNSISGSVPCSSCISHFFMCNMEIAPMLFQRLSQEAVHSLKSR